MPIIRLYFLILKKWIPSMVIYFGIFMMIIIVTMNENGSMIKQKKKESLLIQIKETQLEQEKPFLSYLSEYFNLQFIMDNSNNPLEKRELVKEKIACLLIIPQEKDKKMELYGMDRKQELYIKEKIDEYSINPSLFSNQEKNGIPQQLENQKQIWDTYTTYLPFILIIIIVGSIGMTMNTIKRLEVKRRMFCSAIPLSQINLELICCNLFFVCAILIILFVIVISFCIDFGFHISYIYYMINTVLFSFSIYGLATLINVGITSKIGKNFFPVVLSTILCFISGVFIPQERLGEELLKISQFTPVYWYIKAKETITQLMEYSIAENSQMLYYMLVELLFAITFFLMSFAAGKFSSIEK